MLASKFIPVRSKLVFLSFILVGVPQFCFADSVCLQLFARTEKAGTVKPVVAPVADSAVASVGSFDLKLRPGRQLGKDGVVGAITKSLNEMGVTGQEEVVIDSLLAVPPDFKMGQFAFPTFSLAKALRLAPPKIAADLTARLNQSLPSYISRAEQAGAYVNFHFDFQKLGQAVVVESARKENFRLALDAKDAIKVSLEFSQPNTHKALHVGHLRNMVLGESVARLVEASGHKIDRATYPGDLGTHIAKVLWYIKYIKKADLPKEGRADWLGKMYVEAANFEKEHESDPTVKAGISRTLRNIEERQGEDYALYQMTREWSLEEMRQIYQWLGIRFDRWFCESECDVPSRTLVEQKYKEGLLEKSNGAIGLDLKSENLGFVMMLKSDGSGLYLTKDLELLRQKSIDPDVGKIIVVVDDRQTLHFRQVFRSAQLIGIPNAGNAMHLAYATVNDKDGKAFSSRTLSGLNLSELKATMENKVAENLALTYAGRMSAEQIQSAAKKIALANLKFGFLKTSPETAIRFDMNEWLAEDGNTGTAHLNLKQRLIAISEKFSGTIGEEKVYNDPRISELVYHLSLYKPTLTKAVKKLDPAIMANYIFELSKIVRKMDDATLATIPHLSRATALTLDSSLKLLGIE